VALVTGSTAGLGTVIAHRLAAEGASVVVTGRDAERGEAVAEAVGGTFLAADLNDEAACGALVDEAAEAAGGLTVLVNNAVASVGTAAVDGLTTAAWEEAFRVNVTAPMWLCRAAIPHFRKARHGSIVNVSSRAAERASPGLAAYVASKGALNALTRSLAVDYAAEGIRANTVAPGYVLNERRDADLDDDRRARLEAMHLTRLATAEDVAAAVAFLAGPDAETITGILLPVDGGSSTVARATSFG
jgi:NAD(P)-dependent dehydrogenase (short-subunit alcohol dehydrogenase family)